MSSRRTGGRARSWPRSPPTPSRAGHDEPDRETPLRIDSLCATGQGGVAARLIGLPAGVRQLHDKVLRAFLATGRATHRDGLVVTGKIDRDDAFRQLGDADLVHLDADGQVMVAYPFSGGRPHTSSGSTAADRCCRRCARSTRWVSR